jgi:hypothetical protein
MYKALSIFILASALSCQMKERPKEILTQEQFSALLVDVYMAEAKLETLPLVKDSSIKYFLPFEEKLLKKKGIADSVLRETYAYYMAHPKEFEQIYDSVIDSLALREQRTGKIKKQQKMDTQTVY